MALETLFLLEVLPMNKLVGFLSLTSQNMSAELNVASIVGPPGRSEERRVWKELVCSCSRR